MRQRMAAWALAAAFAALAQNSALAAPEPKHGGTLVFAVDAEPANYDCHANVSFAFLHPVAPHYSTLLKFDTANYPQVVGDLVADMERFARQAYLHVQAPPERAVP